MAPYELRYSIRRRTRVLGVVASIATLTSVVALSQPGMGPANAASSTSLTATADAYLDATRPTINFGTGSTLYADGSPVKTALVRFAVPAGSSAIQRATLRVWARSSANSGLTVSPVASTWTEPTVTYSTAPTPGPVLASAKPVTLGSWVEFDVTMAVLPGGSTSFLLAAPGTTQIALSSRESGTATAPQLVLDTAGAPAPPTAPSSTVPATTNPSAPAATTPAATASTTGSVAPSASTTPGNPSLPSGDVQPQFPIRAAFYYPWFPQAWSQSGISPFSWYQPSRGYYDSRSADVISAHIADLQYAGMTAGISSWWGKGSKEDVRFPSLLQAAAPTTFRWSLYYEPESLGDPSADQISADLDYLSASYGQAPGYLRVAGRPVLFVYADATDGCGMVDRWTAANRNRFYLVLKVFSGYQTCAAQPNGWHQYAPAKRADSQGAHSYSVSPGFWLRTESTPRLPRDSAAFTSDVQAMAASKADFQLVTTYNEWGEGTSVESATYWPSSSGRGLYLDILHRVLAPGATPNPPPASSSNPVPAPTASQTNSATATPGPTVTSPNAPATDPVIAAVGDIACDPSSGSFNAGQGTATNCRQYETSQRARVLSGLAAVLPLGDNQYEDGSLSKFTASYAQSWGRLDTIARPVPGNHEYLTPGAAGYYGYFGSRAGDPTKGYYSYDVGSWHLVALNSNCSQVGGCGSGSAQLAWLVADLAAHPTKCTLAYWHHPLYSSGEHGNNPSVAPLWDALYRSGAELVLSGHDHDYERFAPQNTSGGADPTRGMRAFVVGTGGKNHYGLGALRPNSEVSNADTYGVLALTLHADSYDWSFIPETGKTFTDSGHGQCH